MEAPKDYKEEKYVIDDKSVQFFSPAKLAKFFFAIMLAFFAAFGLLFFIDILIYPEIGVMEIAMEARSKTDIWKSAKRNDLGHEAIAFENMLDAYAKKGGDISHVLDTLTDEFTATNWAELLEYDVDYFEKHEEVNDSIKANGMLHVVKLLYSSGHYDLFKHGFKILTSRFSSTGDLPLIYNELIQLDANFTYDDEEERQELATLYELELRRHLKLVATDMISGINSGDITNEQLMDFTTNLDKILDSENVLEGKGSKFVDQVESDLVQILRLIKEKAGDDQELLNTSYRLLTNLADRNMDSAYELAKGYL